MTKPDSENEVITWKNILLSILACLIPTLIGLCLYNQLPDQVAVRYGVNGADDWRPKAMVIFLLPAILALFDAVVLVLSKPTIHQAATTPFIGKLLLTLIPVIGFVVMMVVYGASMTSGFPVESILFIALGIMMMVLGNLLPKVRRNSVLGVRTPWTQADPDNWIASNRFGGKCAILEGLLIIILGLIDPRHAWIGVLVSTILLVTLLPVAYSWNYARKHKNPSKGEQE